MSSTCQVTETPEEESVPPIFAVNTILRMEVAVCIEALIYPLIYTAIYSIRSDFHEVPLVVVGGRRCCSWLMHYATSRKVACSILDEVNGFFNSPHPSSCTMALASIQRLTEMSSRNLPEGGGYKLAGA
jgi:hypothetical protein